uniref:RNA 3'-terminal phosphate cyclase domain-containing protein n=1 Tax=Zea mays TaxID=4577 RepID=B4FWS2_MAIZE|nr:unknown [Zea mays]
MGRDKSRRLYGSRHFRQRLVLATLTSTAVTIEDIRSGDASPGLRPYEVSLLRLLDKISDHHTIDLNETGTKLRYRPGVIIGGKGLEHDCGVHRGIGYFLEPLILLGLFSRAPISIRLKGITNDTKDPSVDTFRTTTLHMLKHFGVPLDGFDLNIDSRGSPPTPPVPELLRLLRQETGPGAVAVPPHRRQEVAVLQGGAPRLQVLRAPHAPWPQPFKKACGIQDRLVVVARAPVAAPAVHRHHHRASRAPCSGGGQGPRPVPRRRRCWLVAPRRRCFECSLSLW